MTASVKAITSDPMYAFTSEVFFSVACKARNVGSSRVHDAIGFVLGPKDLPTGSCRSMR
jgi:hypothetical protein